MLIRLFRTFCFHVIISSTAFDHKIGITDGGSAKVKDIFFRFDHRSNRSSPTSIWPSSFLFSLMIYICCSRIIERKKVSMGLFFHQCLIDFSLFDEIVKCISLHSFCSFPVKVEEGLSCFFKLCISSFSTIYYFLFLVNNIFVNLQATKHIYKPKTYT